jgi:hypothetical protein
MITGPLPELVASHRDTGIGEGTVLAAGALPAAPLAPTGHDVVATSARPDESRADNFQGPHRTVLLILAEEQTIHDIIDRAVRESEAWIAITHSFLLAGR